MPIEICNLASTPMSSDLEAPDYDVFRATVRRIDQSHVKAHIKVLKKQAIAVELLVNSLAKQLDLPVPECFLVRIKKAQHHLFTRSACFQRLIPDDDFAVFGSATIEHPTLDHKLGELPVSQRILDFIRDIADLEVAAVFDEWIANDDRHERNILIADINTWWLIDNNLAFNKGIWDRGALVSEHSYGNHLGDLLLSPPVTESTLRLWRDGATTMADKGKECDTRNSVQEANAFQFLSPSQVGLLCEFLDKRVSFLSDLIGRRLAAARTKSAYASSSPTQVVNTYQMPLPFDPPSSP